MTSKWLAGGMVFAAAWAVCACKAISGSEENAAVEGRHYFISVSVEPVEAAARVRLLKNTAVENERVEIVISEDDENYLGELSVKTALHGLEIPVYHGRGSNLHQFTMPNGDVHIAAVFVAVPSKNANLSGIMPSAGTLEPAFEADELDYLLRLEPGTADSLSFSLPREHPGASIAEATDAGKTLSPLTEGVTIHRVSVRAQDPLFEKTYTIRIEKKPDARVTKIDIVSPDAPLYPWSYTGAALHGEIAPKLPYVQDNPAPIHIEIALSDPRAQISSDGSIITAAVSDVPLANGAALTFTARSSRTIEGVTDEHTFNFTLARAGASALKASGGDVVKVVWDTEKNQYDEIHIFKSGTSAWTPLAAIPQAWVLVVGAGGNSIHNYQGGGGGGGGAVVHDEQFPLGAGSVPVSVAAARLNPAASSAFGAVSAAGGASNSNTAANVASGITAAAAVYGQAGGQRGSYGSGASGDDLAPNTGRGGQGGRWQSGKNGIGNGAGGSGIVVIRFPY